MKDETMKSLAAIGGITLIEIVALLNGINGTMLATTIGILGGLGGYFIAKRSE